MIINTSTWKEFKLGDSNLFDLYSSKNSLDKSKIINSDDQPKIYNYVSRSDTNNGINFKICKQNVDINKGHCLTIGLDTQTSFYQEHDFYTSQNIQILRIKDNCSKYTYLFLSSIIKLIIKNKFQWGGNGATLGRLKKLSIKLPADDSGNPDWIYMGNYIKYLIEKDNLDMMELSKSFNDNHYELNFSTWKSFKIKDIFYSKNIKKISKTPNTIGDIPFVTSQSTNNGIKTYINIVKSLVYPKNCITISTNGNCFDCFYHDYDIATNTDVEILYNKNLNKYNGLFLITILNKQSKKYDYGRKPKNGIVWETTIKLPVDLKGNPNWEYMTNYIKSLPYSKYL